MREEMPIMRQYRRLKSEAPVGSILLFKMGDFWEAFGEDAVRLSPIFKTTLTRPGKVETHDDGTLCHGWLFLTGASVKVGDLIPLVKTDSDTES